MFTRKRMCPFQQNEGVITDQFSQGQLWKKPCLDYSEQLPWGDNVVNCVKEEQKGMECEQSHHANSGQKVAERLTCPPVAQEQNCCMEISNASTLNNNNCNNSCSNNNNNQMSTDVCPRCQAGESGHYGHIGR